MDLSRTVGSIAIVLAVLLAAGYALGEDDAQPTVPPAGVQR